MDEIIIKAVQQGGPVTIVIGIIALVILARWFLARRRKKLSEADAPGR